MGMTHHDGLAVNGSGFGVGFAPNETTVINRSGYILSGRLGTGTEAVATLPGSVGGKSAAAYLDAGTTGFSGAVQRAVSTALSTVTYVVAQPHFPVNLSHWIANSGDATVVRVATSGHCFDVWKMYQCNNLSSVLTSAGTSSVIKWLAIGT